MARIQSQGLPEMRETSIVTVDLPWEPANVRLLVPVEHSACSCHSRQMCVHKAQALLCYQIWKEKISAEVLSKEQQESGNLEEIKGIADQVCRLVSEQFQTGISRLPDSVCDHMEQLAALCHMFRERAGDLKALAESFRPLLVSADELAYDEKACAKNLTDASKTHLNAVAELFAACDPFDAPSLEAALHGYIEGNGLKFKDVAPALRTALMGFMGGPHLPEIMAFLGKDASLARIRRAAGM